VYNGGDVRCIPVAPTGYGYGKETMKHNCTGSREREMSLMWVCSCGEQVQAEEFTAEEFTAEELNDIEFGLNCFVYRVETDIALGNAKVRVAKKTIKRVEKLLEKVRKM
jgi:hypothetical protein